MFNDVAMKDAHTAIENRRNFQIKARRSVRERLGIIWSLRGYDPMACFGHYGPAAMNSGQSTQREWLDIQYRIEQDRARYIVESYHTVIGWERFDGAWVVPDRTYSMATGRHQRMLSRVVDGRMDFTQIITAASALQNQYVSVVYGTAHGHRTVDGYLKSVVGARLRVEPLQGVDTAVIGLDRVHTLTQVL